MLGVWIGCSSWQPTVDDVCYLLGSVFGVVGLVQQLPILASSAMRDTVQVDASASELRQQLRSEDNR